MTSGDVSLGTAAVLTLSMRCPARRASPIANLIGSAKEKRPSSREVGWWMAGCGCASQGCSACGGGTGASGRARLTSGLMSGFVSSP